MANLVVTSTTNSIKVVFNTLGEAANLKESTWNKSHIVNIDLSYNGNFVFISTSNGVDWKVSYVANDDTQNVIDSVTGVTPTSQQHLCDMLNVLIQ